MAGGSQMGGGQIGGQGGPAMSPLQQALQGLASQQAGAGGSPAGQMMGLGQTMMQTGMRPPMPQIPMGRPMMGGAPMQGPQPMGGNMGLFGGGPMGASMGQSPVSLPWQALIARRGFM